MIGLSDVIVNFNPHSREGSDFPEIVLYVQEFHFNPHSREGSDDMFVYFHVSSRISIHTPAKGVTLPRTLVIRTLIISIHTPAKGVTKSQLETATESLISIHTPAKGVTFVLLSISSFAVFQSTLPRRE